MTTATTRKTSLKINTGPIATIFDCPILFAFYIVGKVVCGGKRRIFVYTFCLINICLSLSDDANKIKNSEY